MKISGSGKTAVEVELLTKLAQASTTNSISKTEMSNILKSVRTDLKDTFDGSRKGLSGAQTAITNTLKLALSSGWVAAGSAKEILAEFLSSNGPKGSLAGIISDIQQAPVRKPTRGTY